MPYRPAALNPHNLLTAPTGASGELRQVPVVTCFVATQLDGTSFKASVHSWEPPVLSERMAVMAQQGKHPCYEARIIIDGMFMGYAIDQHSVHFKAENVLED